MNRAFPGDAASGPTAIIADFIERRLLPGIQYAIDLHSGGTQSIYTPCGYVYGMGERAFRERKLAAAHAFGAPRTAVVSTTSSAGSLSAACERHGVVMVSAELGGGAVLARDALAIGWEGTLNLLRHAGALRGAPAPTRTALLHTPNRASFVMATIDGLFEPAADVGAEVEAGAAAGRIWPVDDLAREPVTLRFAAGGTVLARRTMPMVDARRLRLPRGPADERRPVPRRSLVAAAAAGGRAPMIEIRGVNKWFGQFHVLKDIDLTVGKGERVVVCGPSGSGKSTLIRCINRLEHHDEGVIVVDGIALDEDTRNVAAIRREVGMVFQQFNLFPHLSALENCALPQIRARGTPRGQAEAKAMEYLTRVRIPEQAKKYPASSPAASSSAWPSRGRCAWSRRSCCSTSRPRRSTRK